jgi:hypothetical protein
MKRLLFALLLVGSAQAATVAMMKNNADGLIVLSDAQCKGSKTYVAYATADNSPTMFGCWFMDEQFIHINWNQAGVRSYPVQNWTVKAKSYD